MINGVVGPLPNAVYFRDVILSIISVFSRLGLYYQSQFGIISFEIRGIIFKP